MSKSKGYTTKHVGALTIRTYKPGRLTSPCDAGCRAKTSESMRKEACMELEVAGYRLARLCRPCGTRWAKTWGEMAGGEAA